MASAGIFGQQPQERTIQFIQHDFADAKRKEEGPGRGCCLVAFGKTETLELRVTGMTCGNCVAHVMEALQGVRGVAAVDVDLDGTARVEGKPGLRAALIAAVDEAGYKAT